MSIKPLSDYCEVITKGTTPKTMGIDFVESGIPFIKIENINEGRIVIDSGVSYIDEAADKALSRSRIYSGDVLISIAGTIGKTVVVPLEIPRLNCNQAIAIIRPKKGLDSQYLKHWLASPAAIEQINGAKVTATIANLSLGQIGNLNIDLPPLEEQKRIAAILDKANSLRRKRAQAIALADDFLRATFLDLFGDPVTNPKGWPVAKLGDVTAFENGDRSSNYPSGDDLIESGVLFLSTKNIINKQLDLKFAQYISKEKFDSLSRGKPKFNDLIITLRGTLGNCCVYNVEDAAFINAQMMIIRPGPKVNSTFLQYFMTSTSINDLFQRIGQGAAVPQLTGKQLSELDVFVPEIDLQNAFESIVKKSDVLIGVMEKANIDSAKLGCMRLV